MDLTLEQVDRMYRRMFWVLVLLSPPWWLAELWDWVRWAWQDWTKDER